MYKILSIACAVLVIACLAVLKSERVESTVFLTAPDGFAVACESNYSRSVPHFCASNTSFIGVDNWTITAAGCDNHTLSGIPASAQHVLLVVRWQISSNNTIGLKQGSTSFYDNTTCTTILKSLTHEIREFAAVATGTIIYTNTTEILVKVANGTTVNTNSAFGSMGANANVNFKVVGYYD
jgi:hypothetical protein